MMQKTSTVPERAIFLPKLCAITLPHDSNLMENVSLVLQYGIRWIQYRQKGKSRKDLYKEAVALHELTRRYGALLTVNDHVDVALTIGAEGVHIGQDDLPLREVKKIVPEGMIVGVSTHSIDEALRAEVEGADYLGFGPIFETSTKDAGQPKGVVLAQDVARQINIPVIAIGGITARNIQTLLATKIHGVAISSGIFSGDIKGNCEHLLKEVAKLHPN